MKQPKIKIFGGIYDVIEIGFDKTGVNKVVYQVNETLHQTVFKGDQILDPSLIKYRKIQKPTHHPYHNYAYAPNLEELLVFTFLE